MTRQIKIFDTTLRDGEQSPGCSMNKTEKVEIAHQLEKLGVDIIEAGFAISSKGDFESIEAIASEIKTSTVCSLCRAVKPDIIAAAESIKKAQLQRIHTFIATSPIHMEYKLKMSPDQVLEAAVGAVTMAKGFVEDIEFSCEDAGRSDKDFLVKVFTEVIKAGATTLNVPDTVGYQTPEEFGALIKYLADNVIGIENVDISVHCHDDLGLATANALSGVLNGANQIECTINGIGERAGNTSLEEVVMALKTREDHYKCQTRINTKEIMKTSRLVSHITGSYVQANKAIVGANAFAHEAGIHQDGILKQKRTYEIMDAEMIGLSENKLVLGKHSGRHAFSEKLKELGYELVGDDLNKAFARFKSIADKKKEVLEEDLHAIVSDETHKLEETYTFKQMTVISDSKTPPKATVTLEKEGKELSDSCEGAGSVDAIYTTIKSILGEDIKLVDYSIHSVTRGTDALGDVTVRIRDNDRIYTGRGSSTDVLQASAKAYVMAINKMLTGRKYKRIKPTS
ncbi:2-isopropylmalate synthase [Candidatus Marinamargulisbacteria bacterium SCGC AAA071-K20]|nr:2-isopropylmalate synthase [Candidatus Marinamargulisbacteria bacterium SCGC AAA071-K20]